MSRQAPAPCLLTCSREVAMRTASCASVQVALLPVQASAMRTAARVTSAQAEGPPYVRATNRAHPPRSFIHAAPFTLIRCTMILSQHAAGVQLEIANLMHSHAGTSTDVRAGMLLTNRDFNRHALASLRTLQW